MIDYVHLHVHTEFSLLDGACKIKEIVKATKEMGMKALSITDHGTMFGIIDFYTACMQEGIKPVVGSEIYVAPRTRFDKSPAYDKKPYHLVLLAKNIDGYNSLSEIVSTSYQEGFYYKPRADKDILRQYASSGNLIALSACMSGEVAYNIQHKQLDMAEKAALEYRDIFGPGNFYLEIQDHKIPEQKEINEHVVKIARKHNIPLIATNDVHYIKKAHAFSHDVLLCVGTGNKLADKERLRYPTSEFYLKTPEEMKNLFSFAPDSIENSMEVLEKCNINFTFDELHLPDYIVPPPYDIASYLRHLCEKGMPWRYPDNWQELMPRLNYELDVIHTKGYDAYFVIVWDFINYSREQKIPLGPGRGSAAGSMVSYVLGITDIDPLKYGLIFERFLNPERKSMPDIDIDFCYTRRPEVIEYVKRKYGTDHVAQIITFGRMKAKAAIRDVGRVFDLPIAFVDKIAKLIPAKAKNIKESLETEQELRDMAREDMNVKRLLETAQELEGLARNPGIHAAGVVISRHPLIKCVPLYSSGGDGISTQYEMKNLEKIGLLKMDFLGLRTLTVMRDALELIEQNRHIKVDITKLPLDDPATASLLQKGQTVGVFQLESEGMTKIVMELTPEKFEDLIPLVALYRPGPLGSGMVEDFIACRHGKKKIQYKHPLLEPILKETYGVILYQDQVMKISNELAGFTMGQADLLTRAMGKKKHDVMAQQKGLFIEGAVKKGVPAKTAEEIFDLMAFFAGYGFNKAHSACYAYIVYQTAYLKANYPVELMAANLTSVMDKTEKIAILISECKKMGIKILPPHVNISNFAFNVHGENIILGLGGIKNVGEGAIKAIVEARNREGNFESLFDFCQRVDLRSVNKRVIENLILAGAFDNLGANRAQLVNSIEQAMEYGQQIQKEKDSRQIQLFDMDAEAGSMPPSIGAMEEYSYDKRLSLEKASLGFYISGHPLTPCEAKIKSLITATSVKLHLIRDRRKVTIGGLVVQTKKTLTKKQETMAYLTLEDLEGEIETIVFPKCYKEYGHLLIEDKILLIEGTVKIEERGGYSDDEEEITEKQIKVTFFAEKISEFSLQEQAEEKEDEHDKVQSKYQGIHIKVLLDSVEYKNLQTLKDFLHSQISEQPVYIHLEKGIEKRLIALNKDYWASPIGIEHNLSGLLGENALVWVE